MYLSKLNKLKLEHFLSTLSVIKINMWLTVLYEFDGPLTIWSKGLQQFIDGEISNEISSQDIKRMIYYIYTDFSYKKPNPNKPLFLTHLFTIFSVFRVRNITRLFPIDYRVKSRDHTSRRDYLRERRMYRMSHHVAKDGNDLKSQYYKEYKHIAKKYNWILILNSDDVEA